MRPSTPGGRHDPADRALDLRSNLEALKTIAPHLWPRGEFGLRARVVIAFLCIVAAKLATVYVPITYKGAVDALSGVGGLPVVLPVGLIVAYGLARILSLAFNQLRDALFAKVAYRAYRTVALQVFRHLHALSLRFHLERRTGGLSRIIERGTTAIVNLLTTLTFNLLPTIIELLLVFVILLNLFGWPIATTTLLTVGLYIAFTVQVTEWRLKIRRAMNESDERANTRAVDSLLNYETVKYFGNEPHEAARYDRALAGYEKAAVQSTVTLSLLNLGQALIISVGLAVVMYQAALGITAGTMTVGDFVLVNTYLIQLSQPLNVFGFVYREVKQSLVDIEKMVGLLGVRQEVEDRPGAGALHVSRGEVRFENVAFAYDDRRQILKAVSFTVPPGKTVAIVGASGAGKSTITRLLFRFYDATGGSIRIDGQDIREVTQASLRAAIGIVPQDTVLFNDTIAYNIGYARPECSPSEIAAAARAAHIDRFIAGLPDGYETMVGERGLKLSGGEKQRVAIARVMLKAPPILVFDEATSALDTHTEREIQANLAEIRQGRTTLVIAHRLSTIVDADEILVIDEGRIAERGRHGALLAAGGLYAAMWARQHAPSAPAETAEETPAAARPLGPPADTAETLAAAENA
jgi:ATP-binding cassette subfamily B protein